MGDRPDIDDKFEPFTREDVSDLGSLPGEFRAFRNEMRSALELLINRLLPAIDRHGAELVDLRRDNLDLHQRVSAVEMEQCQIKQRLDALDRKPARKRKR